MANYDIYTDGSALGNPGPGGYGCVIFNLDTNDKTELDGGARSTTNNRMELQAVISALCAIEANSVVIITSDSKYVCDGINKGWATSWAKNGWKTASKHPVKNVDLWMKLLDCIKSMKKVTFNWVKGHAGHPMNERCDELARTRASFYQLEYREQWGASSMEDAIEKAAAKKVSASDDVISRLERVIAALDAHPAMQDGIDKAIVAELTLIKEELSA